MGSPGLIENKKKPASTTDAAESSQPIPYRTAFNRDRLVHIVGGDLRSMDILSALFRQEGFQTTFSAEPSHFLAALALRRIDVAIINMEVADESALPLLRQVKSTYPGTPVIMIAEDVKVDAVVLAMKAGAADVLIQPLDNEYLLKVVRDALRADVHLGAMSGGMRSVEIRGFGKLTNREREVLQLITNGRSNKEAGLDLGISPRTIEVHRARIMEKLGATNTAGLMRIVLTQ